MFKRPERVFQNFEENKIHPIFKVLIFTHFIPPPGFQRWFSQTSIKSYIILNI
jgi:hypothetical protein